MSLRPASIPIGPTLRFNFRQLYADIFWYGLLAGSTVLFLPIFATRLGATSFQIGLLTAGPAVLNLLVSLPMGHWLEDRPIIRATFQAAIWARIGYVALVVLPWLWPATRLVDVLLVLTIAMSLPGSLVAISFNSMFATVVPPEWRGHVVGRRTALIAISQTATSLVCGRLLDWIDSPLSYQIVFGIGVVGAVTSAYYLGRIKASHADTPARSEPQAAVRTPDSLSDSRSSKGKSLLRPDLLLGSFGPFMLAYLFFYVAQFMPIPLFPLAAVRELHLTDGQISLGSVLFYALMLPAAMRLDRATRRQGHRRVLIVSAALYMVYPLLVGLAGDVTMYWAASLLGGGVTGYLLGALTNRLMEQVPADDRPAHMALHNIVLNLGVLGGSMLGPALGDWLGLRSALLIGAGLRLLSGVLFALLG